MIEIKRYCPEHKTLWNQFLLTAKNGHFMFDRDYMEYHGDRFKDHSLLIFLDLKLVAIFPAAEQGGLVISHPGLSFGGMVIASEAQLGGVLSYFFHILSYYHQMGFGELLYKSMPSFYHQILSYEEEYALFLVDANLFRKDMDFVIEMKKKRPFSQRRKRGIKKGIAHSLTITEENDFLGFWKKVLVPNLQARHQVAPVHTVAEISLLGLKFPKYIRQFNVYKENEVIAGATLYINGGVVHAQYIAATEEGKYCGALDLLFDRLIHHEFKETDYFSFGNSNEQAGRVLNEGLAIWKEEFGARSWPCNFYQINTANYIKLAQYAV